MNTAIFLSKAIVASNPLEQCKARFAEMLKDEPNASKEYISPIEEWQSWTETVDNSSEEQIDGQIAVMQTEKDTPFVEKYLKLGYLYYAKEYLGTAAKIFKSLNDKIVAEVNNFAFFEENAKGFNIYMAVYECVETSFGWIIYPVSLGCGCICGCMAIAAVMVMCGIEADDVCSYDGFTGESGGCIGDSTSCCCNSCADCYGCDIEYT